MAAIVEAVAESIVESVAVGGVVAIWSYFTYETFKICDKTLFPPPLYQCDNCSYYFTSDFMTEREEKNYYIYVCKRCEDEELETRNGDEKICI